MNGTVTDPDGPAGRMRVVVLAHRRGEDGAVVLGETITDANGRFRLKGSIPTEIPVGTYRVYAFAPAQSGHDSALSK